VRLGRRWLYLVHRWIGVGACLLFVMWFVSGLVMMYEPFPSLSPRARLLGAEPIAWNKVHLDPHDALAAAGATSFPRRFRLEVMDGEPVYRFEDHGPVTISALDGRRFVRIGSDQALEIAQRFSRLSEPARLEAIDHDQWTVGENYEAHRPLYRIAFSDPARHTVYVSSTTGEVVLDTTGVQRAWNWVGSVPHWLYFAGLRTHAALWTQVVLWLSGLAAVGAVAGLVIGVLRLHLRRRYHDRKASPYAGWMKWHHVGGLVTGLTLTTWIVSGWLSMNPNGWLAGAPPSSEGLARYAGQTEPRFPLDLGKVSISPALFSKEARFVWVAGRSLVVLTDSDLNRTVLDARTGRPAAFSTDELVDAARVLQPDAHLTMWKLLTAEDVYWYAHHAEPRLPMLRVGFDDPGHAWFHIDPVTGEVVGRMDDADRGYRWAFSFLHDFDLPVLLHSRPSWDILVWALALGGLVSSVSGVVIAWRRLRRKGEEFEGWRRRAGKKRNLPPLEVPAKPG
jgi:uncharacterized iron-regulated membrane protein